MEHSPRETHSSNHRPHRNPKFGRDARDRRSTSAQAEPPHLRDLAETLANKKERREAEKQLARARSEARRAYDDSVSRLADYCKRRDPRVAARRRAEAAREAREAAQKTRAAEAARDDFARKRAAWLEERRREADAAADDDDDDDGDDAFAFRCEVCDLAYRSREALAHHVRSKAHGRRLAKLGLDAPPAADARDDSSDDGRARAPPPAPAAAPPPEAAAPPREPPAAADELAATLEGMALRDEWRCAACDRAFGSAAALEKHEHSRAHRAALKAAKKRPRR